MTTHAHDELKPCKQCGYSVSPTYILTERKHFDAHSFECSRCLFRCETQSSKTEAIKAWNHSREAALTKQLEVALDGWVSTLAHLVAATDLLKRTCVKKGAPSDKMFDIMIKDYTKAIEQARSAIEQIKGDKV